jgi:hypothetical protein
MGPRLRKGRRPRFVNRGPRDVAKSVATGRVAARGRDPHNAESPASQGLPMRRRGLEPPPSWPGPGPQPGNPGVICVRIAPDRPHRPVPRTVRTHGTIWMLPRTLPPPDMATHRTGPSSCDTRRFERIDLSSGAGARARKEGFDERCELLRQRTPRFAWPGAGMLRLGAIDAVIEPAQTRQEVRRMTWLRGCACVC